METTRFETFFDAIIAIIITVLVLKIPQPTSATPEALLQLNPIFISYLISFLILYNIWYANHNLFQHIDTIDNHSVWIFGAMTFAISLLPYFTIWVANNIYSIPAETMFGLLFIVTHILNTLATRAIYRSNPYNEQLKKLNFNSYYMNAPTIVLILGFILTYTIYIPGIYVCCLLSVVLWIIIGRLLRRRSNGN
ncbi:TMEM175 family protein [Methanobrevibacter sp.]|uniref:TMEM175 family protein n=1 Tax=Methanobrevibacter sp. TaxID=66852 RepID=UPI0038704743